MDQSLDPLAPDITPLDFFLWGYVKDQIFSTNVGNLYEFHAQIINAVASVTPQILENIWCEIKYHLDTLWATNGTYNEMHFNFQTLLVVFQATQTISQYLLYFAFRNVYNVKTNVHLFTFLIINFSI
jgi:hypothetical protein